MNHEVLEEAVLQAPTRSALAELTTVPTADAPPRRATLRGDKAVRVAIVHDWLVTYAGAEKVLEQIVACFPDADLFSLVDFLDDRSFCAASRLPHRLFRSSRSRAASTARICR